MTYYYFFGQTIQQSIGEPGGLVVQLVDRPTLYVNSARLASRSEHT